MVSLSLELMHGHKGSKPLSVNVLLLGLTAMIFLLHPVSRPPNELPVASYVP